MKLGMMFAGLLAVSAIACTVESNSTGNGAGKTGPVAASPLAGTIQGKSFTGKFAVAKKSGFDDNDPERMISIYDTEVPCSSFSAESPDAYVLLSVPWEAGTKRDFSFGGKDSQTATFVVKKDGETTNIISTTGRVEILDAPTEAGAKGKLRIRASAKGNEVEGEVSVEVCE